MWRRFHFPSSNTVFLCHFQLFELVQGGQPHQKSYYRPQGLEPPPVIATTAVLANPWVRHFKQRILKAEHVSNHPSTCPAEVIVAPVKEVASAVVVSQTNLNNIERDENMIGATAKDDDVEEKEQGGASEDIDNKETHSSVEVQEKEQGFRLWQNRLQIGGQTVISPSSRKDMASWMKRPSSFDAENGKLILT